MEPDYVNDGKRQEEAMSEKLLGPDSVNDVEEQQHSFIISQNAGTGERQPNQYRDVWAAFLFVAAHIVLSYMSIAWGIPVLHYSYGDSTTSKHEPISFTGLLLLVICSSLAALLISGLALSVLMRFTHQIIQISLFMTFFYACILLVFSLTEAYWLAAFTAIIFLIISGLYAWSVWHRIPFAAANLQVALSAIEANRGLVLTAYAITLLVNLLFSVVWLLAWLGIYVRSADCSNGEECISHMNPVVLLALLVMYYWTAEVGKNVLRVTTAGVVGTFWFAPHDASTFCSPAVSDSLFRACTFSLGSICLGSLLTASLQVIHHLARSARRNGRGNDFLLCVLECVAGCLERLVSYFNKWAYVYIGLYGYDYLSAGKKVMALFLERGWSTIINDNLVGRVLTLVSLTVGALTGCFGLLLASARPGWMEEFGGSSTIVAFSIPALIGTAMAFILMSVVTSAVDTVVVAFAEAPIELERNHPGLSSQLVDAWRKVYPEEFAR